MLPIAPEGLPDDRVVGFFQALRFLVKPRQIPLGDQLHTVEGTVVFRCPTNKFEENNR